MFLLPNERGKVSATRTDVSSIAFCLLRARTRRQIPHASSAGQKTCPLDSCATSRCMTLVPPCCSGCHLLHSGIISHIEFIQLCFACRSGEERSLPRALTILHRERRSVGHERK